MTISQFSGDKIGSNETYFQSNNILFYHILYDKIFLFIQPSAQFETDLLFIRV